MTGWLQQITALVMIEAILTALLPATRWTRLIRALLAIAMVLVMIGPVTEALNWQWEGLSVEEQQVTADDYEAFYKSWLKGTEYGDGLD